MRRPAVLLVVALLIAVAWGLYSWLDDGAWLDLSGSTEAGTENHGVGRL